MIVTSLSLQNFRNYEKAEIHPDPKMNLITGDNAQGKTNLLESLVYLSLTRSHRISNDTQLIRSGCPFAAAGCTIDDDGRQRQLKAVIHPGGRTLSVDGHHVTRSSEFIGILNTVLFSPDDLGIYTAAPRERRRILNQEIGKVSSDYIFSANRYQNILKEKNTLLKMYEPDINYLNVLDEQLISEELPVIEKRRQFVNIINSHLTSFYQKISGDTLKAELIYEQVCSADDQNLHAALTNLYKQNRSRDLDNHFCTIGIHRDDLSFELDGRNINLAASQGQKRMLMLAFRMSILEYIRKMTGKKAVLLLDDVLSELDAGRQKRLIDITGNEYQCLITSTAVPDSMKQRDMKEFRIRDGIVME